MRDKTNNTESNAYDYKEWETSMSKVVGMSEWPQMDKTELFFENME